MENSLYISNMKKMKTAEKIFYKLGQKAGETYAKGKWYLHSAFGSQEEAIKAEYLLGKKLAKEMLADIYIDVNPKLNELVKGIGNKLSYRLTNKYRKFTFYIQYTKDVNAFALPGGFIFITYGLLKKIEKEPDEIAFVLAHEMMHVVLGHSIGRILTKYSTQVITTILMKYSKFGAIAKQVIGKFINSSYSRENELEADSMGVKLMNAAGYNSKGSEKLLMRLDKITADNFKFFNYFNSHPPITERIEKIQTK